MELPVEWHPFEVERRLKLAQKAFVEDFELRYPETRKRLAYELTYSLSERDRKLFRNLILQFRNAKRVVSIFDWGQLLEWNERLLEGQLLSKIDHFLNKTPLAVSSTLRVMQDRLREIQQEVRSILLEHESSTFQLLSHRWRIVSLRDESNYLIKRAKELL